MTKNPDINQIFNRPELTLKEAARPLLEELHRLERDYGFDCLEHQCQVIGIRVADARALRAALANIK